MKIKNLSYKVIDEANVNASFDIVKNDGTLLLEVRDRGFTVTADTLQGAKDQIKQNIRNIRDTYQSVKASKLINAMDAFVAQTDVDIEA